MQLSPTQARVLGLELGRNQFAQSTSCGYVVEQLANHRFDLATLLGNDQWDAETIFRSKPDGGNRPGWHGTPVAVATRSIWWDALEEAYWTYASTFDENPCFWRLLQHGINFSDRLVPLGQAIAKRQRAMYSAATDHGRWVVVVDLRHFFRDLRPQQVYRILGPDGLNLPESLLSWICSDLDPNVGLAQSSLVSDLIVRLILIPLDRFLRKNDLPSYRLTDDVYCLAADFTEAKQRLRLIVGFFETFGLTVNRQKVHIEPPSRFRWAALGLIWGNIPIERYDEDSLEVEFDLVGFQNGYGGEFKDLVKRAALLRRVNWPLLYLAHHAPAGDNACPYLRNLTLSQMVLIDPDRVSLDARALVNRFPASISGVLSGQTKWQNGVAATCFESVPERVSLEDDQMAVVLNAPEKTKVMLIQRWLSRDGVLHRGIRNRLFETLSPDDESLSLAVESMPVRPWLDEACSFIELCLRVDSRYSRHAMAKFINSEKNLGLAAEILAARS